MKSLVSYILATSIYLLGMGSSDAVKLAAGPPDPDGSARAVANTELRKLRESGSWPGPDSLHTASLGEPFYLFWADSRFLEFAKSESDNILDFVAHYSLSFPIYLGERPVGALNIRQEAGRYFLSTVQIGEGPYNEMAQIRGSLNLARDERLSELTTNFAGAFYIVENGARILRMAPMSKQPGLENGQLPAFRPATEFVLPFKQRIREATIGSQSFVGQLDSLAPIDR